MPCEMLWTVHTIETEAKLDVFLPPCSFQYEQLSEFFSKPSSQQYRFSCSFRLT